jgi:hypothetical protein
MKDKRKIVLGTKDVSPKENNDIFLNVEISRSSDELVNEIIDNNFNLSEQFNKEREESLKFCIYGSVNCISANVENLEITLKTNHNDILNVPRIQPGANSSNIHKIRTKPISNQNKLSKNIFKQNKAMFYFMFELGAFYNNVGETKSMLLSINDKTRKIYANLEIPFLFFDSEGQKIPYGTETIDFDLDGNEQTIENDYPFLYDTHWVKNELNLTRALKTSFRRSIDELENNVTVDESDGEVKFIAALDFPSVYGIEEAEVYVQEDNTVKNPSDDYIFEPQKISWGIGEQYKEVSVDLIDDLFVESAETVVFGFRKLNYTDITDLSSTFTLNINDKDKPINAGFSIGTKTITASATTLTVFVTLESKMNVPNQTLDVVFDNELSTAIIGEDIENTGTEDEPEFRKTINFTQGSNLGTFEVELFEIFKYNFDKTAIFRFENPSQNVKIDESRSEFTLTIENSIIPRYATYNLANNAQKGQGLFRMSAASSIPTVPVALTMLSGIPGIPGINYSFKCKLEVINRGDDIIFEDKIVGPNEVIKEFTITNGYEPLLIQLTSNSDMNFQTREYQNCKYEFLFKNIQPLQHSPLLLGEAENPYIFDNYSVEPLPLSASTNTDEIKYYLTSTIGRVATRLKTNSDFDYQLELLNLIANAGIVLGDSFVDIRNKIFNYLDLNTPALFNPIPNPLGITTLNVGQFISSNPGKPTIVQLLQDPALPDRYICTNALQQEFLNVKINGILFFTKIYTSETTTGPFGFQVQLDETQVSRIIESKFESEEVDYIYCDESNNFNPLLPPAQPI